MGHGLGGMAKLGMTVITGRAVLAMLMLAAVMTTHAASAAKPAKNTAGKPILQIDSGGHSSLIRDVVFTPDGKYLVSASEDKLVRVWDWRKGKTVRSFRGQSGAGSEGKIFAMALSPDGTLLAVGGWMWNKGSGSGHHIRLYDFHSGRIIALLKGHGNVVLALAFSPDSRWLVSGQGGSNAQAILWELDTVIDKMPAMPVGGCTPDRNVSAQPSASQKTCGRGYKPLPASDERAGKAQTLKPAHRLKGHTDHIYAVGFAPLSFPLPSSPLGHPGKTGSQFNVVTGSLDHDLRLWDGQTGKLLKVMRGHTDDVSALAVHRQDGKTIIASGAQDHSIKLWDGRTGRFLRTLADQGTQVGSLSFSPDGKTLLSSCGRPILLGQSRTSV